MDCLFAQYDKKDGWGSGIVIAPAWIAQTYNSKLQRDYPGLYFVERTRKEWADLVDGKERKSSMPPVQWLAAPKGGQGFLLPLNTQYSYWTSDIAQMSQNPPLYPNWANWVIDLRVSNPDNGQFWYLVNGNPNDPIGNALLLLGSNTKSALDVPKSSPPPYPIVYGSGQDKISPGQ